MENAELTKDERMAAYKEVTDRFSLRHRSRTRLDRSPDRWKDVYRLLEETGALERRQI